MSRTLLQFLRASQAAAGLAVLAFLLGATPHVVCLCPNGNYRPICLATMFSWGGCCGHQSASSKSCCQHTGDRTNSGCQVSSRCCTQTVTAAVSLKAQVDESVQPDRTSSFLRTAGFDAHYETPSVAVSAALAGLPQDAGPPVDRIIVLLRLTI